VQLVLNLDGTSIKRHINSRNVIANLYTNIFKFLVKQFPSNTTIHNTQVEVIYFLEETQFLNLEEDSIENFKELLTAMKVRSIHLLRRKVDVGVTQQTIALHNLN